METDWLEGKYKNREDSASTYLLLPELLVVYQYALEMLRRGLFHLVSWPSLSVKSVSKPRLALGKKEDVLDQAVGKMVVFRATRTRPKSMT